MELVPPCSCDGSGLQVKIGCQAGTTLAQIQGVFNNLPANSNLGDVVLNFPPGAATSIPKSLLGNNAAYTIEVVGPTGTPSALTVLKAYNFFGIRKFTLLNTFFRLILCHFRSRLIHFSN